MLIKTFSSTLLLSLISSFSTVVNGENEFDWRIRLLIVAKEQITDGHLRFFRTAMGVSIPAQIISVKREEEEVSKVLDVIQRDPYRSEDVLVVINSDQYIVGQDAVQASWMIVTEAIKNEASIMMASPTVTSASGAHKAKNLNKKINETLNALQKFRDGSKGTIKPRSEEESQEAQLLLKKLKRLEIEEKQNYRNSLMYDSAKNFRAYAFAGLVSSVVEVLKTLREDKILSIEGMWNISEDNLHLQQKYGLAMDNDYQIFQNIRTVNTENYLYREGHDGKLILEGSENVVLAPFLYAVPSQMPFVPANMMAKEIAAKKACKSCLDEPLPPRTPLNLEEAPVVQLTVLIEREIPFLRLFLRYLKNLSYPKKNIYLFVYISPEAKKHLNEVTDYLNLEAESYEFLKLLHPSEVKGDTSDARNFLWENAVRLKPDYLFWLEANAHLTNPDTIQELIHKKRNIVGPLLKTVRHIHTNIMTEYDKNEFSQGPLYHNYIVDAPSEERDITFKGLMQVPHITGAVLMSWQVYLAMKFQSGRNAGKIWDPLFSQLLRKGFIPYVSNEVSYGYLIEESKKVPDFWNLEENTEASLTFYITPPSSLKVMASDEGSSDIDLTKFRKCPRLSKENVFTSHFVADFIEDLTFSSWSTSKLLDKNAGIEVLEPPSEYTKEENIYVQSILRYLATDEVVQQIPEINGRMRLIRASSGQLPTSGTMMVIIGLVQDKKESIIEISPRLDNVSTPCIISLREGEATFLKDPEKYKLYVTQPTTVGIFSI